MTISLIIPTYKRFDCLAETLNSLMECEKLPDEVIIADQNESTLFGKIDREIRKNALSSRGSLIAWKHIYSQKVGITASRNCGLKEATGEIVVFTDDDVHYSKDFFANILLSMTDDSIAMIGGVDYNVFPSRSPNILKRLLLTVMGLNGTIRRRGSVSFGIFGKYPCNFTKPIPTEWAMGYCMIFRREILKKSGLTFDEKLTKYGYGEDLELTYLFYRWCRNNKYKSILVPSVGVYHMVTKENRLDKKPSYLRIFVNRQYINWVLNGNSIFHRILVSISNFWYRLDCRSKDKNNDVNDAYRHFLNKKRYIENGQLDDSFYL